jgi:hypothetical protein
MTTTEPTTTPASEATPAPMTLDQALEIRDAICWVLGDIKAHPEKYAHYLTTDETETQPARKPPETNSGEY